MITIEFDNLAEGLYGQVFPESANRTKGLCAKILSLEEKKAGQKCMNKINEKQETLLKLHQRQRFFPT